MPIATPTPRQHAYLDYIAAYLALHGCAPTEAEMQRRFAVSPPSVHTMILTLERRGFIHREPGTARSIRLVSPAAPSSSEPSSPPRLHANVRP
jgi:SOS-response transcriptional repressor LexA